MVPAIVGSARRRVSVCGGMRGQLIASGDQGVAASGGSRPTSIDSAILFAVLNLGKTHWCLLAFNFTARVVRLFDSCPGIVSGVDIKGQVTSLLRWVLHWRDSRDMITAWKKSGS